MLVDLTNVNDPCRKDSVFRVSKDPEGFDIYVSLKGRQASITTDRESIAALHTALGEILKQGDQP